MSNGAWTLDDDATWVKGRREEWRNTKPKLRKLLFLSPAEIQSLQAFFLTGKENPDWPLCKMEASILLECWLTADQSEENWERIKRDKRRFPSAWTESQNRYRETQQSLDSMADETGSVFSGLEERLYKFLFSGRFVREDYPNWSDEEFFERARELFRGTASMFVNWIDEKNPSPYNSVRWQVQEWRDALLAGYYERPEFPRLIQRVEKVLAKPDKYKPEVVQLVREINEVLRSESLSDTIRYEIERIRKNGGK